MIVRLAIQQDATEMTEILNQIIAIGGTTSYEHPKTIHAVLQGNITGPAVISSIVAEQDGQVIGWQSTELWQGDAYIGTFVRPSAQAKGAGRAMFVLTCEALRAANHSKIIALIRADNVPGLRYYARIGFVECAMDADFALETGRVVGRKHWHYDVF